MKKIIVVLLLLGVNLSSIRVLGDHYDITTMYKFNTEETYLDGEVITRYLNTCSVSVHPQTNAIDLPYMNMDTTQPGKNHIYPLKTPAVPPFSSPFESSVWKTLTSSKTEKHLPNTLLQVYQSLFKEKYYFLTFIEKSSVLGEKSDITDDVTLFDIKDMADINEKPDVFLFVQIKKGDLRLRKLKFTLLRDTNYYVNVMVYYNGLISICIRSNSCEDICNLQTDEYNQASFLFKLKGHFELYDVIAQKKYTSITDSGFENYEYREIATIWYGMSGDNNGYSKFTCKLIQISPFLSDDISVLSPWLNIKNSSTLIIAYAKNSDAKLITSLKEQGTEKCVQLESEDLIKISTNQSDIDEVVVAKVNVIFPENWNKEKQIHIKAEKHVYISNIWEGGNLELYQIHDNKSCVNSNMNDIFDVALQDIKTRHMVSECLNGGIFDNLNKKCSCPPGFTGDTCEIACGKNYFGQKCSKLCSNTDDECKGKILCTPSYKCACAAGYHGDKCLQECKEGTYGADCSQTCGQCKGGCDRYTGDCRECESPYLIWPACKEPHSYWKESPVEEGSTYNSIKLSLDFSPNNIEKYLDVTKFYFVQYIEDAAKLWNNCSHNPFTYVRTSYVVRKLNAGRKYLFRVLLVDKRFRTNDPELSKISSGITQCTVSKLNNNITVTKVTNSSIALTWNKEFTVVGNECPFSSYTLDINDSARTRKIFNIIENTVVVKTLIPGHSYEFNLRKNTIHGESVPVSSIRVTTETTTDNTMRVAGVVAKIMGSDIYLQWFKIPLYKTYYIKSKLIRRISCNQDEIESPLQVVQTSATNHTLSLEPYAQYEIFVTIDPTQEKSEHNLTEITDGKLADIAPTLLKHKFRVTNESTQVYWADPTGSCNLMNGFFQEYQVQLLNSYTTILNTYETSDRKLEITGLTPKTDYKLRIRYVNHFGVSQIYAEQCFITKATSSLTIEDLTAYKTSASIVGLRWKITDSNLTITAIIVNIQSQADSKSLNITDLTELQCKAWPSYVCYSVPHLKQNTKYTISVDIFSNEFPEGGLQKSIQVVTREAAPSPVNDIKVEDISNTNMTISWKIPFLLNGILRKFLIEVEHLSSFDETLCCQSVTTITSAVTEEKDIYNHVLENIQNASSYQVTIRAFTKRLGQETSKIIDTAPQLIPIKHIPQIQVGGGKVIIWQDPQVTSLSSENELISDLLIIVESNENNNNTKGLSVLMKELGHNLSNNWWLAHVCPVSEECSVNIGTGEENDSPYGTVRNSPLTVGHKYTVVLAQVNKYLSARSYTIAKSAQFEMDSTTSIMSTTETTTQNTAKYNSSELFHSTHLIPETNVDEVESTLAGADEIVLTNMNVNSQEEISTFRTDYETDNTDYAR